MAPIIKQSEESPFAAIFYLFILRIQKFKRWWHKCFQDDQFLAKFLCLERTKISNNLLTMYALRSEFSGMPRFMKLPHVRSLKKMNPIMTILTVSKPSVANKRIDLKFFLDKAIQFRILYDKVSSKSTIFDFPTFCTQYIVDPWVGEDWWDSRALGPHPHTSREIHQQQRYRIQRRCTPGDSQQDPRAFPGLWLTYS